MDIHHRCITDTGLFSQVAAVIHLSRPHPLLEPPFPIIVADNVRYRVVEDRKGGSGACRLRAVVVGAAGEASGWTLGPWTKGPMVAGPAVGRMVVCPPGAAGLAVALRALHQGRRLGREGAGSRAQGWPAQGRQLRLVGAVVVAVAVRARPVVIGVLAEPEGARLGWAVVARARGRVAAAMGWAPGHDVGVRTRASVEGGPWVKAWGVGEKLSSFLVDGRACFVVRAPEAGSAASSRKHA
jgi:hypothetical protein